MPFEGPHRTLNEQQGSTSTTLVLERPASPEHNSGNSEPHPIQQVSGPVSPAEVGLRDREQMESVNRNTDFELTVGNNKNLSKDAPQNIGETSVANLSTKSLYALFGGRRVKCAIGNNENNGAGQTLGALKAFNEPPTCPCAIM